MSKPLQEENAAKSEPDVKPVKTIGDLERKAAEKLEKELVGMKGDMLAQGQAAAQSAVPVLEKLRAENANLKEQLDKANAQPKVLDLLRMFDQGTPEHAALSFLPYMKSLDNEIANLEQQQRLINNRLAELQHTRTRVRKIVAELAAGDDFKVINRFE